MESFKEVASVTEIIGEQAVLLLDENIFENIEESKRKTVVEGLLTLTKDRLMKEYSAVDDVSKVSLSVDPSHQNTVIVLRMLMNEDNIFELLTYFGGKVNPETTVKNGLLHAAQIVSKIEENL